MVSYNTRNKKRCSSCHSVTCSNSFRDFCLASSMHGLKYVVERESYTIHRCVWVLFFALGVMASLFLSLQMWYKWDESPLVISIDTSSNPVQNLVFPAVTICSVNKVSRKKFDALMELPKYSKIPYENLRLALRLANDIGGVLEQTSEVMKQIRENLKKSNITLEHLLGIMRKVMVPCEDVLVSCKWQNHDVNCREIFDLKPTDNGFCCVFNTIEHEQDKADQFLDEATAYAFNETMRLKKPRMVPGTGVNTGLVVLLDAHVEDYTVITSKFNGFKVLVHEPNEFPDITERGLALGTGTLLSVAVKGKQFYSKPFVQSVPFKKRKCYLTGERQLEFYDNYTAPNCYVECMTKLMLDNCNCHPFYFPVKQDLPICHFPQYSCIAKVFEMLHDVTGTLCSCPELCDKTYYSTVLAFAQFPGIGFYLHAMGKQAKTKIPGLNYENSTDYAKHNLAMLEVYFDDRFCELYVMSVRFGVEDFISSIGGLLGLGFGFSFISAVEFFYFLCIKNISSLIYGRKEIQVRPTPRKRRLIWTIGE